MPNKPWTCVAHLNDDRNVVAGSLGSLAAAVKRGADIRCYTTFDYADHMGVAGSDVGLVEEVMDFGVAYWLGDEHAAGIQTLRYPANSSLGFLPMPSLSFFLYNGSGQSGIARPFLDGTRGDGAPQTGDSGNYRMLDNWDASSRSPSHNYTYRFGLYKWWARDCWEEVLSHDGDGAVINGSMEALVEAFREGRNIKVGVSDLCSDLVPNGGASTSHEVFVQMGPIYNHRDQGFLGGESHPVVRVAPGVPLAYGSGNWDFGWILPRTDGIVYLLTIDPYTREFIQKERRCAIRWFVC